MSPSGYISLQDASREMGVSTADIRKAANTAGIRQYQSKGMIVYKVEDFEKVLEIIRPSPKARDNRPVIEDIDIESLFAGQQGGSVDSGLFDNTGLSGSGLFDATDAVRPQVGEKLVSPSSPAKPDTSTARSGPVVKPPGPAGEAPSGKTRAMPAVPTPPGAPPIKVVQGMPIGPPAGVRPPAGESPSRVAPGIARPSAADSPSRVAPGISRPQTPPESPSRIMRVPEQASRVGPAAPAPPRAQPPSPAQAAPGRPPPPAQSKSSPSMPAIAPPTAAKAPAGSSWVSDFNAASAGSPAAVSMDITNLADEVTVAGGQLVDSSRRLFIDDSMIAEMKGVTRVLNQPTKFPGNPVVMPDTAWEADGLCSLSGSVLYDREDFRFKMWYYAVTKLGRAACYAVSSDGIRWEKPDCGQFPFNDLPTNIIMANPAFEAYAELCGVIKDTTDDPSRWYKAVYQFQNPQTNLRGLKTAVSPDGIRWTPTDTLLTAAIETAHFLRDERTGKYVIHGRLVRQGRRAVQRLESDNFKTWTAGELVLEPDNKDPEGDDVYSLNAFPYGRQYIGLVQMFHGAPQYTLDAQLAVSADGLKWDRAAGRAVFLPMGKIGEWDRYQISPSGRPALIGGKELWFYYGCRAFRHPPYLGADKGLGWAGIGLARLRRDGFVHLESPFDPGTVTTPPVVLKGAELRLNAAGAYGSVQVALLDKENRPLDGMSGKIAAADAVDAPVAWEGGKSLAGYAGRPVRLKFTLKNARLYSFWMQ